MIVEILSYLNNLWGVFLQFMDMVDIIITLLFNLINHQIYRIITDVEFFLHLVVI